MGKCNSCSSAVSSAFGKGVQNFLSASHCLLMAGGVKCKKLGIFMSSALANFPGVDLWEGTKPCRTGNGTVAGWKLRGPGHTAPQSWSTDICLYRGGGTSGGFGRFDLSNRFVPFVFLKFNTRNSENLIFNFRAKLHHVSSYLHRERPLVVPLLEHSNDCTSIEIAKEQSN